LLTNYSISQLIFVSSRGGHPWTEQAALRGKQVGNADTVAKRPTPRSAL
jgi:hypothetical protein